MQTGQVIKANFGFPQPTSDRVIVEPMESELVSQSIVIPDTVREGQKPTQGKIVAVGPGSYASMTGVIIPMRVKEGQTVVFTKYAGDEMRVNGRLYLLVKEESILCVLK